MKRLYCISLCFLIVLTSLTACTSEKDPKNAFSLPLKITAHLEGSDAVFTAFVTETCCDVEFEESHALAGTKLHFSEEQNTASVGDFTREISPHTFPAQESLIKAIRAINSDQTSGTITEKGVKYTIDELTIMVYYNTDTNELTGIRTEESGRRFDFVIVGLEPYEIQSNGAG